MLPARVEGVIEERLGRLTPRTREIITVAAVEGGTFTVQVVARAQNIPEREVFRVLSQELMTRHRLVKEAVDIQVEEQYLSRYEFSHDMFQEYLYNTLSVGERRLLHDQIAAALEVLYREQVGDIAPQLARHFAESGDVEKAVAYLQLAGDKARLLYAHQAAVNHYQQALALLNKRENMNARRER